MRTSMLEYYPVLKEDLRLHLTPGTMHLMNTKEPVGKLRYINHHGGRVLEQCNGSNTISDIISMFTNGLARELVSSKVLSFLEEAIHSDDIELHSAPMESRVHTCGNTKFYTPLSASFEVTTRCNQRCKHCYRSCNTTSDEVELSELDALRVITILSDNGVYNIELTGGDPFMNPHIFNILKLCLAKMRSISILTNATRVDEKIIDYLSNDKHRIFWQISVESIDPAVHDEFRGMAGSQKLTSERILKLTRAGHKVRIAANITPYNINSLVDTARYAYNDLGAYDFSPSPILPKGRAADYIKSWEMSYEQMNEFTKKSHDVVQEIRTLFPLKIPREQQGADGKCGATRDIIVVSPDGYVRPCVISDSDQLIMGNLLRDSYTDIFGSDLSITLQNLVWPDHSRKDCGKCEKVAWCEHCIVRAIEENIDRVKNGNQPCSWVEDNNLTNIVAALGQHQAGKQWQS